MRGRAQSQRGKRPVFSANTQRLPATKPQARPAIKSNTQIEYDPKALCLTTFALARLPLNENSQNNVQQVDEASAIIRGYLAVRSCALETLRLRGADVDDGECCHLMEALDSNESLTELDISGEKEGNRPAGYVVAYDAP